MNKHEDGLINYFEKLVAPLGIETLKPRRSDSLDFHELSVWSLLEILTAAYEHGKVAGKGEHG